MVPVTFKKKKPTAAATSSIKKKKKTGRKKKVNGNFQIIHTRKKKMLMDRTFPVVEDNFCAEKNKSRSIFLFLSFFFFFLCGPVSRIHHSLRGAIYLSELYTRPK